VISADVVIVGGGIQGLVLLDELTRQGYGCLLVTKSDLGTGQTLHSHGLPNSGTGVDRQGARAGRAGAVLRTRAGFRCTGPISGERVKRSRESHLANEAGPACRAPAGSPGALPLPEDLLLFRRDLGLDRGAHEQATS